jgi:hypothetical protein
VFNTYGRDGQRRRLLVLGARLLHVVPGPVDDGDPDMDGQYLAPFELSPDLVVHCCCRGLYMGGACSVSERPDGVVDIDDNGSRHNPGLRHVAGGDGC